MSFILDSSSNAEDSLNLEVFVVPLHIAPEPVLELPFRAPREPLGQCRDLGPRRPDWQVSEYNCAYI
jgi:hypothetical protein